MLYRFALSPVGGNLLVLGNFAREARAAREGRAAREAGEAREARQAPCEPRSGEPVKASASAQRECEPLTRRG